MQKIPASRETRRMLGHRSDFNPGKTRVLLSWRGMTMMMVVVVLVLLNDQNWKWRLYIWHLQGTISARVKVSAQPDFYWGSLSSAPTQRGQVMLARVGSGISTKPRKTKVGRHKTRLWLLGDYDDDGDALYQTMKLGRQSMCPPITLWIWLWWYSRPPGKTTLEGR